jgi:hypothetical protein
MRDRWNPFEEKPIENGSEFMQILRKLTAADEDRIFNAKFLMDIHDRLIIFYNYNYERDILIQIAQELGKPYWEWNGHAHQEVPNRDKWLYLVQYTAGAEGWNCITTNTILFYSLNYSFKIVEQAEGRIDRLNTPYTDLEYYFLTSNAQIDKDIYKAIKTKEKFNESAWLKRRGVQY